MYTIHNPSFMKCISCDRETMGWMLPAGEETVNLSSLRDTDIDISFLSVRYERCGDTPLTPYLRWLASNNLSWGRSRFSAPHRSSFGDSAALLEISRQLLLSQSIEVAIIKH